MADKPEGLTTEQLLIELGRVVMGLGTKMDSIGQKLDAIHEVLSEGKTDGGDGASEVFSMDPLLEKLDSIHQALSAERPVPAEGGDTAQLPSGSLDIQPLLEKLDELKEAMKSASADAPGGTSETAGAEQVDITPLIGKLEELRSVVEKIGVPDELKVLIENLSASVEKMPGTLIEGMEKKIDSISEKLEEINKTAADRQFVETLTGSVDKVREGIESSGSNVVNAVNEIPVKLDGMGEEIAGSMGLLQEKTEEVLHKANESLDKTDKALDSVKEELEKGLKLNTDMTGQMVELTSRFADRAEEDRISDLNSQAVEHFNNGEYQEADKLFKEALNLSPENPELLCNSANVLAAQDDLKGAETMFRKALEASPELEPALSGLGMIMVKTDRAEQTIEFLKSTILSGEPSIKTTIAYTRALAALDRHDEAVELLEASLRGAPDNPEITQELAGYGYEGKN